MQTTTPSLIVTCVSPEQLTEADYADWVALDGRQASPANPFLCPVWVMAWYEQFVDPNDRRVVLVRHAQTKSLVGVAPMHFQAVRAGAFTLGHRLMPVGAGVGPNPFEIPGFLTARGSERDVARALVAHTMASDADWCELAITPEQGWFEPEWMYESDQPVTFGDHRRPRACVILPLEQTWGETKSGLKRNLKESLRRSQNRLAKDGRNTVVLHRTGADVDPTAVGRMLELHRLRSNNERATVRHKDSYADARGRALLLAAIPRLAAEARASIFELILDGEVVASQLALHAAGGSYVHSSGFRPDSWSLGPVTYLHAELVKAAIERGDSVVNFSPGPNVSKLRWSEKLWVSNEFAFGSGPNSLGVRYGAYQAISAVRSSVSAIKFSAGSSRFQRRRAATDGPHAVTDRQSVPPAPDQRLVAGIRVPVARRRIS